MANIESTSTRSKFFPQSKADRSQEAERPSMKRNNYARKAELDKVSKRDAKVEIPESIKDYSRIKKAVDMAPEVDNSDKIAKLKEQINNGSYKVDYDALADKMLSSEF